MITIKLDEKGVDLVLVAKNEKGKMVRVYQTHFPYSEVEIEVEKGVLAITLQGTDLLPRDKKDGG